MQCIVRTLISTDENIVQQILEIYDNFINRKSA